MEIEWWWQCCNSNQQEKKKIGIIFKTLYLGPSSENLGPWGPTTFTLISL